MDAVARQAQWQDRALALFDEAAAMEKAERPRAEIDVILEEAHSLIAEAGSLQERTNSERWRQRLNYGVLSLLAIALVAFVVLTNVME